MLALLEWKAARRALLDDGDALSFAVELAATGEVVGDFTLRCRSLEHRQGEIGFVLHPDHHGRGYATEAAAALLRVAFEEMAYHRVIGRIEVRNEPFARVLERLGMRREAHFVENEFVKGTWESEVVYALLAREWRAPQGRASPTRARRPGAAGRPRSSTSRSWPAPSRYRAGRG